MRFSPSSTFNFVSISGWWCFCRFERSLCSLKQTNNTLKPEVNEINFRPDTADINLSNDLFSSNYTFIMKPVLWLCFVTKFHVCTRWYDDSKLMEVISTAQSQTYLERKINEFRNASEERVLSTDLSDNCFHSYRNGKLILFSLFELCRLPGRDLRVIYDEGTV